MKNYSYIQPIILSGGLGTRLWPLSRKQFPKQYIVLNSSDNLSFFQKTQKRLKGLRNIEKPIIICNEEQRFIVAEQMRQINISPKSIILEPFGRNTAPAIAIAALKALEESSDSILLVLSSDHEIKDPLNFRKAIENGINDAITSISTRAINNININKYTPRLRSFLDRINKIFWVLSIKN